MIYAGVKRDFGTVFLSCFLISVAVFWFTGLGKNTSNHHLLNGSVGPVIIFFAVFPPSLGRRSEGGLAVSHLGFYMLVVGVASYDPERTPTQRIARSAFFQVHW